MRDMGDMDDLEEMDGMEGLGRVGFAAFAFLFASFAVEREIYRKGRKVKDAKLAKRSGGKPAFRTALGGVEWLCRAVNSGLREYKFRIQRSEFRVLS
jgi:hypothetical protein